MKFLKSRSKEIKELQPEESARPDDAADLQAAGRENYQPPARLPELKKIPLKPLPRLASQSPPIFIKVEKYREIIKGIRDLRSYILNLRDTLDVLVDMQRELANGIEIAQKTLDELSTILANLDSFFIKPQGTKDKMDEYGEQDEQEENEPGEIQSSMNDVYGHLEKLRAQLKSIS
jgi:hypothetical protein